MLKFLRFSIFDVGVFLSFKVLKMLKKQHISFLAPLIRMLLEHSLLEMQNAYKYINR